MKITLIKETEDNDNILLDKYYRIKGIEEGNEIELNETELSQKREIWDLSKMETMVANDETLTNRYNEMAVDGPFKFGYHWNEVIMNLLFNEYVLQNSQYMDKYLSTIPKKKKRRGNPDRKIDSNEFIKNKKNIKEMEVNENNVKTVRDLNTDEYEFISNSQDVESIIDSFGDDEMKGIYDSVFVKFTPDGDVVEIWGLTDVVPYLNKSVDLIYPKDMNETTSSGSSGQFSGPFMWAKDSKNMRFAKKPVYFGGQIVENINHYEKILKGLEEDEVISEDRKTSSMINKDRIGSENAKNFKKDLSNNNIADMVVGFDMKSEKIEAKDTKSHQDIEDEKLKEMEDFKPVKHEATDEYKKKVQMQRGKGMQDLKYDIEPAEKFEERAKEDMGEELYELGKEKIEIEKNQPMYDKDVQPVSDKKEFDEKINESYYIVGKYKLGNQNIVHEFDVNNVKQVENIDENYTRLFTNGMGNIYDNKSKLVENVSKDIDNFNYFINFDSKEIVKMDKSINEGAFKEIDTFKRLSGYSSLKAMKG